MGDNQDGKVYLRELAALVDRPMNTLRIAERTGLLPENLLPKRDDRGFRYWTESQAVRLQAWYIETGIKAGVPFERAQPGKRRGAPYKRSEEEARQIVEQAEAAA